MPQHDSFMPRHATPGQKGKCASCRSMTPSCRGMTPNSAKIKPHDLSLFFTLLNPIPSTQTLTIFPNLQPFTLANFHHTKSQFLHILLNINNYSTYSCKIWRVFEELEKVEILKKPQQFKIQVSC